MVVPFMIYFRLWYRFVLHFRLWHRGFAACRLNHWLFSLRRDHPKKLGVTRGSRLAVQSAYGADGAIHQEALVVGMRAQI